MSPYYIKSFRFAMGKLFIEVADDNTGDFWMFEVSGDTLVGNVRQAIEYAHGNSKTKVQEEK